MTTIQINTINNELSKLKFLLIRYNEKENSCFTWLPEMRREGQAGNRLTVDSHSSIFHFRAHFLVVLINYRYYGTIKWYLTIIREPCTSDSIKDAYVLGWWDFLFLTFLNSGTRFYYSLHPPPTSPRDTCRDISVLFCSLFVCISTYANDFKSKVHYVSAVRFGRCLPDLPVVAHHFYAFLM